MRALEPDEKLIDVVREDHDGLSKEEWTFHTDGSMRCFRKAFRSVMDHRWSYTSPSFADSPIVPWMHPPQDVLDEAAQRIRGTSTIETTVGAFEPERVDFGKLPEAARLALISAMTDAQAMSHVVPGGGLRVLLVCNGAQLSFEHVMRRWSAEFDRQVQKAARGIAEEKIKLSTISNRLSRLSDTIDTELDALFPLAKLDEDGW